MREQGVEFIELAPFSSEKDRLADDLHFAAFQQEFRENPLKGDLIRGTAGARKVRWAIKTGRGKSGGARVIYYFIDRFARIYLIDLYVKSSKTNSTEGEKMVLKTIVTILKEEPQ